MQAFLKLGFKINAFLFSPFGRRILKDVLSYHIVPNMTVHTDYYHKATVESESIETIPVFQGAPSFELVQAGLASFGRRHRHAHNKPSFFSRIMAPFRRASVADEMTLQVAAKHFDLPTLFNNTKLPVDIYEFHKGPFGRGPLRRSITVGLPNDQGDRVKVAVADGVAYRAAVHVRIRDYSVQPLLIVFLQIVDSVLRPPFHHEHEHDHAEGLASSAAPRDPAMHMWRRLLRAEEAATGNKPRSCHGRKRRNVWSELLV